MDPLLPRTNSSGTRSQTLSPRQCLASSFGLLRRGSPRKRRTLHCFLSELGEHLFGLSLYYFPCTSDHAAAVRQQHGCIGFGGSIHIDMASICTSPYRQSIRSRAEYSRSPRCSHANCV